MSSLSHSGIQKDTIWILLFIVALLAVGFLGFYEIGRESLWTDEAISVFRSQQSLSELIVYVFSDPIGARPLYWFALQGWMALFGTSEVALRSLSVLFGITSIWLLFQLGRVLFGIQVAAVASFLLATSAIFVWYMQEARMYTLLVMMTLLSYLLYVRILQGAEGLKAWVMYLLSALGTILAHQVGILVFASQIAHYALFHMDRRFISRNLKYIAIAATVVLVLFILSSHRILTEFAISPEAFMHPYVLNFHTILGNYVVGMHTWYPSANPWPVVLVGLFSFFFVLGCLQLPWFRSLARSVLPFAEEKKAHSSPESNYSVAMLLIWVLFATIIAWIGTGLTHLWQIRYTLAGMPAFLLLTSLGLVQLMKWKEKWGLFAGAVGLSLMLILNSSSLYSYYTTSKKPEFRQAAAALLEMQEKMPLTIYGFSTDSGSPMRYYGVSEIHYLESLSLWISWFKPEDVENSVNALKQIAGQEQTFALVVADHPHPRCECVDLKMVMEKYAKRLAPQAVLLWAKGFYRVWVGVFQGTSHGDG